MINFEIINVIPTACCLRHNIKRMNNKDDKFRRVHFAVTALEGSAKKLNIPGNRIYCRLKKQNLISERLFKHYELLHTQSREWVVEDTIETLKNWEKESRMLVNATNVNQKHRSNRRHNKHTPKQKH